MGRYGAHGTMGYNPWDVPWEDNEPMGRVYGTSRGTHETSHKILWDRKRPMRRPMANLIGRHTCNDVPHGTESIPSETN